MIEINLIPDVKRELIRAKRTRNIVVSGAIIVGIVSVGIVVLLCAYLFGGQTLRNKWADDAITANYNKLKDVPDLANMLTIQNQLASINEHHSEKNIDSRLFDLLVAINPAQPNQVTFSQVKVDSENSTIYIAAQAANGYVAADALIKTIKATSLSYTDEKGTTAKTDLAKTIAISNQSYGEDTTGAKVLRFSISFEYASELFANTVKNVAVIRPDRQNATDSLKYLPESLFTSRASDLGGDK